METMDGIKKKQGTNPLVEVAAAPSEPFQFVTLREQFRQGKRLANGFQRSISNVRVRGGNDLDKLFTHRRLSVVGSAIPPTEPELPRDPGLRARERAGH